MKPHKIKDVPDSVEEAWWYSGKNGSVHITFVPYQIRVPLANGSYIIVPVKLEQINLDLKQLRRKKT